ncbi:MAG: glycosyltransferase family 39 protein [bacterium]|nr:glycosyltransferase family 39 protein [bacterium]
MRKYRYLIVILFLALAWQGYNIYHSTTENFVRLPDDSYYYYEIGRNIAQGLGSTFDGENPTNGYHPLWMGITVATYYLVPNDPVLPIIILRFLEVLFFLASTVILWKILQKITDKKWLTIGLLLFYALNLYNWRYITDGLESSLALFLLSLFMLLLIKALEQPGRLNLYFSLGAIAGLMTLARTDYGLFAAVAFIYLAIKQNDQRIKKIFLLGVPATILVSPWLLYNWLKFGAIVQGSGLAYTLINHDWFLSVPRNIIEIILWSGYQFSLNVFRMLAYVGLPIPSNVTPLFALLEITIIVGILAALWLAIRRFRRQEWLEIRQSSVGKTLFIILAGLFLFVLVHGGVRWATRPWYFISIPFLATVALALSLEKLCKITEWPRKTISTLIAITIIILGINAIYYDGKDSNFYRNVFRDEPKETLKYQMSQWINDNLPEDARIASFNSGVLGYYSHSFVMNSDGLVNNAAYEAMKEKNLWKFFQEQNIEYIADSEAVVTDARVIWLGIKNPLQHLSKAQVFYNPQGRALNHVYKIEYYDPYELRPRHTTDLNN